MVFTAYGAVPFVADSAAVMREVRPRAAARRPVRLLDHAPVPVGAARRPGRGGPDACAAPTSTARRTSSRTPQGQALYVEHHRTLGDRVRELTAAGLRLVDLVEPEWPASNTQVWGGWSPLRGALVPGTAIFVTVKI